MSKKIESAEELLAIWAGAPQNTIKAAILDRAASGVYGEIIADLHEMMSDDPALAARAAGVTGEALDEALHKAIREALGTEDVL